MNDRLVFIAFILFVLVIVLLYVFYVEYNKKSTSKAENLRNLLRQTSRWAVAAEQDTNPYITNLHATYALGYLNSIKTVYTEQEIMDITNISIKEFEKSITEIMDKAIQKISEICPEGKSKNEFLNYIASSGEFKVQPNVTKHLDA